MLRKLLHEPLVHFLALGAVVFLLFNFSATRATPQDGTIVVSQGKIGQLLTGFSRTWHRPPSQQEFDFLIEDYIREEVFYREAIAMGLDRDDTIVRRRMRQKLEFLTEDSSTVALPTDQELQRWIDQHPDAYRIEPEVAFSQLYFNGNHRGENAAMAASNALARIEAAGANVTWPELGDLTMLPRDVPLTSIGEVARLFGDDFAQKIGRLPPGQWAGPLLSGYGWHLVYVSKKSDGGLRPLADVREAVQREWMEARRKEMVEATYRKLREKHEIVLEGPPTRGDARSASPRAAKVAEHQK